MEIREVHDPNDGRDPFPVLIRRQKMAKDRDNIKSKHDVCLSFHIVSVESKKSNHLARYGIKVRIRYENLNVNISIKG